MTEAPVSTDGMGPFLPEFFTTGTQRAPRREMKREKRREKGE